MDCNYGEVHCDSVKIADRSDSLRVHHKHVPWKIILVSYTRPLFRSTKANYFIGQLWQLLTASNVGALTQAWQAKRAVFKIPGFVCKRFLPFFPTPSPLFYLRHFSRGLWLSFLVLCSYTARKRLLRRLAKGEITSKKVCIWTRKTFWVFHSLSQVCETIYRYIYGLKLFDNWVNCNCCCCCWYTSKERNCIETTCIWKDFVSKQPVTIGVCLPRDDDKEKISRPF